MVGVRDKDPKIPKVNLAFLLTIVPQSFLQTIATCGRTFGCWSPNNTNVTTDFWRSIANEHQCDNILLGVIEKKKKKKSDDIWWKTKISLIFLTKLWVKNQTNGKEYSSFVVFFLIVTVQKKKFAMTKNIHTIVWSETRYQIPSKGFVKVVRIGKGGPIFRKEFPPKVEVGNWVRRNKLWGMGTLNKPKTSKPTCSLKIEQTKNIQTNMFIKNWTNQKNIQTNMIIKHWTKQKTLKPTRSLNIEQTKITLKPTWSLNIEQSKKHWNQHDP